MTVEYNLGPQPLWYLSDLVGEACVDDCNVFFYNSLNKSQLLPVYQDAGGINEWPNPIQVNSSGNIGPIYLKFDSDNPQETYYIRLEDKNGSLIWDVDNYEPDGSGGGSIVTNSLDLNNYIINSEFYFARGIYGSSTDVSNSTDAIICRGSHSGLNSNFRDLRFIKDNTTASDALTFEEFSVGSNVLINDVPVPYYLNFTTTSIGTGETLKSIQIPICHKVQNFQGVAMTFDFWGRSNSGSQIISVSFLQFFGSDPGSSSDQSSATFDFTLTSEWQRFTTSITVPTISSFVIGDTFDDCLSLRINLPINSICSIDVAKPSLYLGNTTPQENIATEDQVNSKVNGPRTGDFKQTFSEVFDMGWIACNDLSIGSFSSSATNRASNDTFLLYELLWNTVSDANAPVSGGRGSSAADDFTNDKEMFIPRTLGRVLTGGIPASLQMTLSWTSDFSTNTLIVSSTSGIRTGMPIRLSTTGTMPGVASGDPQLENGRIYYAIEDTSTTLLIAQTFEDATSASNIVFTSNVTGTASLALPPDGSGQPNGSSFGTLIEGNLPPHTHSEIGAAGVSFTSGGAAGAVPEATTTGDGSPTLEARPFSVLQDYVSVNFYLKL